MVLYRYASMYYILIFVYMFEFENKFQFHIETNKSSVYMKKSYIYRCKRLYTQIEIQHTQIVHISKKLPIVIVGYKHKGSPDLKL